ncbi:hypothetical protein K438DRAFT_1760919 [Mycena galopus ATCC 62051]|nr:hypothetical protein K438DRAFT_1760919 [Mycena galopus ATCC 62051]
MPVYVRFIEERAHIVNLCPEVRHWPRFSRPYCLHPAPYFLCSPAIAEPGIKNKTPRALPSAVATHSLAAGVELMHCIHETEARQGDAVLPLPPYLQAQVRPETRSAVHPLRLDESPRASCFNRIGELKSLAIRELRTPPLRLHPPQPPPDIETEIPLGASSRVLSAPQQAPPPTAAARLTFAASPPSLAGGGYFNTADPYDGFRSPSAGWAVELAPIPIWAALARPASDSTCVIHLLSPPPDANASLPPTQCWNILVTPLLPFTCARLIFPSPSIIGIVALSHVIWLYLFLLARQLVRDLG